jgi:hypothetical protein
VALVGGRRDATLVAHDANRSARRPISRREVRPALDTLAGPLLGRVGGNGFVAASHLLVRLLVVVLLGTIYAQVYRYRHVSTPAERQRTKWVLFGFLLWWLLIMMLGVPYRLELNLPPGSPLSWLAHLL